MYNYANLNKRGFQSVRQKRVKSRLGVLEKSKEFETGVNMLVSPGSGVWWVSPLFGSDSDVGQATPKRVHTQSPITGTSDSVECIRTQWTPIQNGNNGCNKGAKQSSLKVGQQKKRVSSTRETNNQAHNQLLLDLLEAGTANMTSLEQKKKALKESIASLRQRVQEQEDEELRELMEEERKLKLKLKEKQGVKSSKVGSKGQGLQNLAGIKFDMTGFMADKTGADSHEINDIFSLTEPKRVSSKKAKKLKVEKDSESESEEEVTESDSSSKDEVDEQARRKKKGKNGNKTGKSGIHSKIGDSVLSNEWYAHVALEDAVVGEKSFNELTFNLLVAGELEIIGSGKISEKEKNTRVEVLKTLAYKFEFISMKDVLALYSGFLGKIEKGKFKWGSKAAMRVFEQQLMYCVTVERNRK